MLNLTVHTDRYKREQYNLPATVSMHKSVYRVQTVCGLRIKPCTLRSHIKYLMRFSSYHPANSPAPVQQFVSAIGYIRCIFERIDMTMQISAYHKTAPTALHPSLDIHFQCIAKGFKMHLCRCPFALRIYSFWLSRGLSSAYKGE